MSSEPEKLLEKPPLKYKFVRSASFGSSKNHEKFWNDVVGRPQVGIAKAYRLPTETNVSAVSQLKFRFENDPMSVSCDSIGFRHVGRRFEPQPKPYQYDSSQIVHYGTVRKKEKKGISEKSFRDFSGVNQCAKEMKDFPWRAIDGSCEKATECLNIAKCSDFRHPHLSEKGKLERANNSLKVTQVEKRYECEEEKRMRKVGKTKSLLAVESFPDNSESSDAQEKESETDSEKEHGYELEEINNSSLNTIREERETGSETSAKKPSAGDDSSPEESTIKQTWSGSVSPGLLSSGSDFSSSDDDDDEEVTRTRNETKGNRGKDNKRNSITKDCNSDFHWVVSEKQSESKSLFDTGQKQEKESRKYYEDRASKNSESNPFYSMDRSRNSFDYSGFESAKTDSTPVQLRLPPQSPGSLDRKRLPKSRFERDQKSKSSIISRSPQSPRKSLTKSLVEEINLSTFSENKKHDYFYPSDEWSQCYGDDGDKCCQHYRSSCGNHGCYPEHCGCHHYFRQMYQPPCRSYYGSCESLQEKSSRKNSFGSQRSLCEERRSPRKSVWQENQQRLMHGSNECIPSHCCQSDREKAYSWRFSGKSGPELEERVIRLENDKESLQLQVSVLTEQVEAQSEKISDLQQSLEDKKQQLTNTEDLLQREILTRSSLETQKLELMSAISELKLQQAALERENYELKEEKKRYQNVKPPMMPRNTSPALLQTGSGRYVSSDYGVTRKSSSPFSNQEVYLGDASSSQPNSLSDSHHKYLISSTPNNKVLTSSSPSPVGIGHQQKDNVKYFSSSPQPNTRRSMDQYNSLPRQKLLESQELSHLPEVAGRGVAFGKGLTSLITLKSEKSYSAPNLAETEKHSDQLEITQNEVDSSKSSDASQGTTKKGIKKIFNKIKRSNSGNVNDLLGDAEFKRGGIRATAGPRLGGHIVQVYIPPDKPFSEWDTDNLCGWLEELGLENYVADLRRWVKSGSHLLSASSHEIEKELGMKNHLHKKKLLLALQEMSEKGSEADELLKPAGCLDTAWVMRWLDDVGLPQHKEVFLIARIDGRMLHRLTMDDLATMHITSALHVASLKKGIKVLREHKMDPNCLTRRSVPEEPPPTAADVALWTNHRVMEWLRVVDLAEYAPNLRGSGVHGALMVYETKFTAELLASLLNIPPNKTLLRRHLNTHFKELLGRDVIQVKREAETTLGYIPLTPSAKVKAIKKPQFTLKRKKNKNDVDFGDLVCPLDDGASGENTTSTNTCLSANGGEGGMKEKRHVPDVCPATDSSPRDSPLTVRLMRI